MRRSVSVAAALVLFFAFGVLLFAEPIVRSLIKGSFDTVSFEDRVSKFRARSVAALEPIDMGDLLISVSADTLRAGASSAIDQRLSGLEVSGVDPVGTIEVVNHDLDVVLDEMFAAVIGTIRLTAPERDLSVEVALDIAFLAQVVDGQIVYVPALRSIELLSVDSPFLSRWPFSLAPIVTTIAQASVDAINGALREERVDLPGFHNVGDSIAISLPDREITVRRPQFDSAALLISNAGVAAIATFSDIQRPVAVDLPQVSDSEYVEAFSARFKRSNDGMHRVGENVIWISDNALTSLVVDDPFTPITAEQVRSATLARAAARLQRMGDPSLVFSVPDETITALIRDRLNQLSDNDMQLGFGARLDGTPDFTIGEGALEITIPLRLSEDDLDVRATAFLLLIPELNHGRVLLNGAVKELRFDAVTVPEGEELGIPADALRALVQSAADSVLPAINSLLQGLPVDVPLSPFSMIGTDPEEISLEIGERTVSVFGPVIDDWATLLHPDGLTLVAQLSHYDPEAVVRPIPDTPEEVSFNEVRDLVAEIVQGLDPSATITGSTFLVSLDFLARWLEPVGPSVDREVIHRETIESAHRRLLSMRGPDVAVSIPTTEIRRIAFEQLDDAIANRLPEGVTINRESVSLTFEAQMVAASLSAQLKNESLTAGVDLEVQGFAGYGPEGKSFRFLVTRLEITDLVVNDFKVVDFFGYAAGMSALLKDLLPILNSTLKTFDLDIAAPNPIKIDMPDFSAEGVALSPTELELAPLPTPIPVLLIEADRILAIADIEAAFLPDRQVIGGEVPRHEAPGAAFAAFREAYTSVWARSFDWRPGEDLLRGEISSPRIAASLSGLWSQIAVSARLDRTESNSTPRQDVAALPPDLSCQGLCSRPGCDRNRTCPLRTECRNVTKLVTVPTKEIVEVCEPVTRVVTDPVEFVERECRNVTNSLPWPLSDVVKLVCDTVTVVRDVQREVTETVCSSVEEIHDVQKEVTEEVCEQAVDTACVLALDECSAEWEVYELCAVTEGACTLTLKTLQTTLETFDFDKFGYASSSASGRVRGSVDGSVPLEVSDDLRSVSIVPGVSAFLEVDLRVNFEPRASAFFACAPLEPLRLRNYRLDLTFNDPVIAASIETYDGAGPDGDPSTFDITIRAADIPISGRFERPPLTQLMLDTPSTLLTCPLLGTLTAGFEIAGSTSLTRGAVEDAVRLAFGDDADQALVGTRLLLEGVYEDVFAGPEATISIPVYTIEIADERFRFRPALSDRSIVLEQVR